MIVLEIVTDSLRQIGVIGQTKTPSAEQGADAVNSLNDMMASMAEDGIDLGWNQKASTATACALPAGHVATIKAMLAVVLGGKYGVEVPIPTVGIASDGYKRLVSQAVRMNMRETRLDNLPSGNAQSSVYNIETGQ